MGVTTSKQNFYVPGLDECDGTFRGRLIWPHFHRSPVFIAGGHEWSMSYYPNSLYDGDSVDLCLHLESEGARVTISSAVGLVDPTGSLPPLNLVKPSPPLEFDSGGTRMVSHWVPKNLLAEALHQSYLLGRGGLVFEWIITVLPEMPMRMPEPMPGPMPQPAPEPLPEVMPVPIPMKQPVQVPTVDPLIPKFPVTGLPDNSNAPEGTDVVQPLPKATTTTTETMEPPSPKVAATTAAKVLPSTDVTFSVGGELFHAHKAVLCMRSPVFMEELSGAPPTTIEVDSMSMVPDVFEALLHYVYTDTLLAEEEEVQSDDKDGATTRGLLVAADQYGMDELKVLCEERLAKMVDVDNVADMLALADEQSCVALEDACIGFMMAPGRMRDVVASKGYQRLRMKNPSILVDVLEKSLMLPQLYVQDHNVHLDDWSDWGGS